MDTQDAYPAEAGGLSLQEAIQADLTRLRGMNMRFAERLDAMAETEARPERLAQLNNAVVKTARAVRQIAVLQLEIAGERPLPNVRAPVAAADANRAAAAMEPERRAEGPRPCPRPWDTGDYTDYDDYSDDDRRLCLRAMGEEAIEKLRAAQNADLRAAGRGDVCNQSFNTKLPFVRGIPHPAFDACLKDMNPELALLVLGADCLNFVLAHGTPDALAEYDAQQASIPGPQRRDSG